MVKHEGTTHQAAVIAVRQGQICLITSSSGRHWLLPKGHLEQGEDLRDTARQEAWEEAGLLGRLVGRPVGRYRFRKLGKDYLLCRRVPDGGFQGQARLAGTEAAPPPLGPP
jgi:8-oxo-dGTP pyrophosphatase MutT (NUDIX family)